MSFTRREFVKTTAAAGLALGLVPHIGEAQAQPRTSAPLKILILGGTGFIGPHEVRRAMERGHQVTIFNRGRRATGMFQGVEELLGDRAVNNYESLKGQTWDAVIDNSASAPGTAEQWVEEACALLKDSAKYYLFVSSTGVFLPYLTKNLTEATGPVLVEAGAEKTYGVAKARSEKVVQRVFPKGAIIIRPGYIAGPGDGTDRYTYWPWRVEQGGEMLAPGKPTDTSQYIDVRDLTDFMIHVIETGNAQVYNVTGHTPDPMPTQDFLNGLKPLAKTDIRFTWVDDYEFLREQHARFSIWIPPTGNNVGHTSIMSHRAVAAGLKYRPMLVTARETLEWHRNRVAEAQQRVKAGPITTADSTRVRALAQNQLASGITLEREAEILKAWHARTGG